MKTSAITSHELRVDASSASGANERLLVAATVFLPAQPSARPRIVMFGFPGGGYSRRYFDVTHIPPFAERLRGYSQARFHAARGIVFVACDHVGVGDSEIPRRPLDYDTVADADMVAAAAIVDRLRDGSYAEDGTRIAVTCAIALGQSFGGFLLTLGQARRPSFDAVALLGWSGIRTVSPYPPGADTEDMRLASEDPTTTPDPRGSTFHHRDVPCSIVTADLTRPAGSAGSHAPWGSIHRPGGPNVRDARSPLDPGVVAEEAATITVPVFVGAGDIDVVADPHLEASAYRSSRDVTIATFPNMAHMHNFASTRELLWQRLEAWASVASAGAASMRAPGTSAGDPL